MKYEAIHGSRTQSCNNFFFCQNIFLPFFYVQTSFWSHPMPSPIFPDRLDPWKPGGSDANWPSRIPNDKYGSLASDESGRQTELVKISHGIPHTWRKWTTITYIFFLIHQNLFYASLLIIIEIVKRTIHSDKFTILSWRFTQGNLYFHCHMVY